MKLSEVIGLPVVSESGERLGHVHDVCAELTQRTLWVTDLFVGRLGVLERLGIGAPRARGRTRSKGTIPWSEVVRIDKRGVVVRDRASS